MSWSRLLHILLLCLVVRGSLVDDIVSAIEEAVTCTACHALLIPLQTLAVLGDAAFSDTFTEVCKATGIEDDDVCAGVIGQQGPIIAHDLRSISALGQSATKLCDSVLGLCQPPAVNKHTMTFPKAAPANPKVWTSTGKTPIQVSHFSDVHIDRSYTPGADANCTKPICCRDYADSPATPTEPAGAIGEHNCDTSTALIQSMLKVIPATNAFSIFTGDVVEAAVWLVDQNEATNDLNLFNNEMATLLKTTVYPVIGNHEVAPMNLFPRNTSSTPNAAQWVFDTQSAGWTKWINSTAASEVSHNSGSYSIVHPGTLLRIISLNTGYWYKANLWLYDSDTQYPDPNGIFAFLIAQLQAAEDAGQRAWIIGHMPPGGPDCLHDQSNYFDQIVQRYKNTIAAQFYGHSHQDQFEIAYSDYTKQTEANAVSVAWIAPSLTPRDGNPAFKTYDIDPDTYEVMDAHVFYADVSSSSFQTSPTWAPYYSVRATWGSLAGLGATESLGPAFWHRVTELFESNDAAFQQYNTFLNRGYDVPSCDADCKALTICGLRALRAENNCQVSTPGLNIRKRDDAAVAGNSHRDNCEGSGLHSIFSPLQSLITHPTFNTTALKLAMEAILAQHQPPTKKSINHQSRMKRVPVAGRHL